MLACPFEFAEQDSQILARVPSLRFPLMNFIKNAPKKICGKLFPLQEGSIHSGSLLLLRYADLSQNLHVSE